MDVSAVIHNGFCMELISVVLFDEFVLLNFRNPRVDLLTSSNDAHQRQRDQFCASGTGRLIMHSSSD
jgi:hypothetical protein